jgi:hypothetical protein
MNGGSLKDSETQSRQAPIGGDHMLRKVWVSRRVSIFA